MFVDVYVSFIGLRLTKTSQNLINRTGLEFFPVSSTLVSSSLAVLLELQTTTPALFEVYAGRRTDFRDEKSRDFSGDFSGEIFLEQHYCPYNFVPIN